MMSDPGIQRVDDANTDDDGESLARLIAQTADEKKGDDVVVLDVGDVLAIAGWFVIASASNSRLVRVAGERCRGGGQGQPRPRAGADRGSSREAVGPDRLRRRRRPRLPQGDAGLLRDRTALRRRSSFEVELTAIPSVVAIFGAIAQLVERFHGMEEVRSSILLSSTKKPQVRRPGVLSFSGDATDGWATGWATPSQSAARPVVIRNLEFGELIRRSLSPNRSKMLGYTMLGPPTSLVVAWDVKLVTKPSVGRRRESTVASGPSGSDPMWWVRSRCVATSSISRRTSIGSSASPAGA